MLPKTSRTPFLFSISSLNNVSVRFLFFISLVSLWCLPMTLCNTPYSDTSLSFSSFQQPLALPYPLPLPTLPPAPSSPTPTLDSQQQQDLTTSTSLALPYPPTPTFNPYSYSKFQDPNGRDMASMFNTNLKHEVNPVIQPVPDTHVQPNKGAFSSSLLSLNAFNQSHPPQNVPSSSPPPLPANIDVTNPYSFPKHF